MIVWLVVSPMLTCKKAWKRSVTHQCGVFQKHSDALVRKEEIDPKRKMAWSDF